MEADLGHNKYLAGAKVRTLVYMAEGTNDGRAPEFTDLSTTRHLTQDQLSAMDGDSGTILPGGLKRPAHWPELDLTGVPNDPTEQKPPSAPDDREEPSPFAPDTIKANVTRNRRALILNNASLLAQIAAFREDIRKSNRLAFENADTRDGLLAFLDRLAEDIENLTASVPDADEAFTNEDAEETAGYFARFIAHAKPGFAKYFTAENLGDAAPPASIILGCGTIGYLVTGLNPLGFGAGTLAGKFITNEIKSGAVADKVEKLLAVDDTPPDP